MEGGGLLCARTRRKLGDYLQAVSKAEENLQEVRQQLNRAVRFHPDNVFYRITQGRDRCKPTDLLFYLNEEDLVLDEDELYILFKEFDSSRTANATSKDFQRQLLSQDNKELSEAVKARVVGPATGKELDAETRVFLKMYFLKRMEQYHQFQKLREGLFSQPDFSLQNALRSLVPCDQPALQSFLRSVGLKCTRLDIQRIMRALSEGSIRRNSQDQAEVSQARLSEHLHPFYQGYYTAYYQQFRSRQSVEAHVNHSLSELSLLEQQRAKAALRVQVLSKEIMEVQRQRVTDAVMSEQHRVMLEKERMRQVAFMSAEAESLQAAKALARSRQQILRDSFYAA